MRAMNDSKGTIDSNESYHKANFVNEYSCHCKVFHIYFNLLSIAIQHYRQINNDNHKIQNFEYVHFALQILRMREILRMRLSLSLVTLTMLTI